MIGIYDTGLGGKYIADQISIKRPDISVRFYSDTNSLPLGDKSPEYIRKVVSEAVEELFQEGCGLVILACNTASVHTIRYLQQEWLPRNYPDRKVLGVTVPLRELVQTLPLNIKVSSGILIATGATVSSNFYQHDFLAQGVTKLQAVPMPQLASAIEVGDDLSVTAQLDWLQTHYPYPAYIILACTHYTYITQDLVHRFPDSQILDPSNYIIERAIEYYDRHQLAECKYC